MNQRMQIKTMILGLTALVLTLGAASSARADTITTLFSTGVDGSRNLLADGAIDSHYTVSPGSGPYVIGNPASIPWVGNTATSQWITPATDTRAGPGPFTYTTTFDLTGLDPTTAQISGMWSSDNEGTMFLNGVQVATDSFPGWTSLVGFSITSNFQNGINTLTFVVPNGNPPGDGPTGLQVDIESATANPVPEPTAFALLALGGVSLAGWRRWRMRVTE
jgi:hypothetical protein